MPTHSSRPSSPPERRCEHDHLEARDHAMNVGEVAYPSDASGQNDPLLRGDRSGATCRTGGVGVSCVRSGRLTYCASCSGPRNPGLGVAGVGKPFYRLCDRSWRSAAVKRLAFAHVADFRRKIREFNAMGGTLESPLGVIGAIHHVV